MSEQTTTRRAEALALLALDTLTGSNAYNLDYLTALQAMDIAGEETPHNYYGMQFSVSTDSCLTLKLPDRCIWKLYHGDDRGASATVLFRPAGHPALEWGFGRAATLPIAMLKSWWSIQQQVQP